MKARLSSGWLTTQQVLLRLIPCTRSTGGPPEKASSGVGSFDPRDLGILITSVREIDYNVCGGSFLRAWGMGVGKCSTNELSISLYVRTLGDWDKGIAI